MVVNPKTVIVRMGDKLECLSRDRVVKAPKPDVHIREAVLNYGSVTTDETETQVGTEVNTGPGNMEEVYDEEVDDNEESVESTTAFVVNRIVEDYTSGQGTRYRVLWYGYEAEKNT